MRLRHDLDSRPRSEVPDEPQEKEPEEADLKGRVDTEWQFCDKHKTYYATKCVYCFHPELSNRRIGLYLIVLGAALACFDLQL